jgi:hypothetical protein
LENPDIKQGKFQFKNIILTLINLLMRFMKMKNKSLIAISVFITVLVLTVGVGVITKVSASNGQTNVSPTLDAAAYIQREQAYQQIISQANQQIAQANQQIASLASQIGSVSTVQATPVYAVTADQASSIAQQLAGSAPNAVPQLVSYSGTPAYEVVYNNGKIYVDANSGSVLYNGLQTQVTNVSSKQALYIAMNYLPTSQPVAMNYSTFNGARVYVVAFADGQSVYVNMAGNIVAVQMAQQSSNTNQSSDQNGE